MKILIIDSDLEQAAVNAAILHDVLPKAIIAHTESFYDAAAGGSDIVIADPAPTATKSWVDAFRLVFPVSHLVITSNQYDIISGTKADNSYAISKPFTPNELVAIVSHAIVDGKPLVMPKGKSC